MNKYKIDVSEVPEIVEADSVSEALCSARTRMTAIEDLEEKKGCGKMYCAVEGCGKIDESHTAYCSEHSRSFHKICGEKSGISGEIMLCPECSLNAKIEKGRKE